MLVDDDSFRFLLQLQLPGARGFRRTQVYDPHTRASGDGVLIDAHDLSHAEVIDSPEPGRHRRVIQAGPRRLWDSVETAHRLWCELGRPDPGRFGVVANPGTQFVWFDTDEGWYRWAPAAGLTVRDLPRRLAQAPDGRRDRGRVHPVAAVRAAVRRTRSWRA